MCDAQKAFSLKADHRLLEIRAISRSLMYRARFWLFSGFTPKAAFIPATVGSSVDKLCASPISFISLRENPR